MATVDSILRNAAAPAVADPFLSPAQVCDLIPGMTEKRLENLRSLPVAGGLRFYKPSPKTVVYRRSEVIAYVESKAMSR